ncbi:hypothetical protein [Pontibacter sp. H249]|uniref:hypothetical protein n=1 Tax=Pontibacter sp. H249 TaxID=3133420 RepID=UPI0030C63A1D
MIHADDIRFDFVRSLNMRNQHHTLMRNNELGLQMETISNKTKCGTGITKSRSYYFIDNDEREFLTVEDLVDAYNEKFKLDGESPEHEVKYIKVYVKRENLNIPATTDQMV